MATSESGCLFYAQAYSSDRRSHFGIRTYTAMITNVCEPRGSSRKLVLNRRRDTAGGMPVRRYVAGNRLRRRGEPTPTSTRPSTVSIGKGAVMSLVGTFLT